MLSKKRTLKDFDNTLIKNAVFKDFMALKEQ